MRNKIIIGKIAKKYNLFLSFYSYNKQQDIRIYRKFSFSVHMVT